MTREEIEHLFVLKHYDENGIIDFNEVVKLNDNSIIERTKHHTKGFVDDNWATKKSDTVYELTEWGKVLKKYLKEKEKNEDKSIWFWRGAIVAFIAALIGSTPTIIEKLQKPHQDIHIDLPKMVLVHDTIIKRDTTLGSK
jgi:hypothetical protein